MQKLFRCVICFWPHVSQRMLVCVLNHHSSKDSALKLNEFVHLTDHGLPFHFLASPQFFLRCCLLCWWFSFFSLHLSRSFQFKFISAAGIIEFLFPAPAQSSPPCLVCRAFLLCLAHSNSHTLLGSMVHCGVVLSPPLPPLPTLGPIPLHSTGQQMLLLCTK